MTEALRIVGEWNDYAGFVELLLKRIRDLDVTLDAVDDASGLPDGYTSKLTARCPIKGISRRTIGELLKGLGVKNVMVVDEEQFAKVRARLTRHRSRERWAQQRRLAQNAKRSGSPNATHPTRAHKPNPSHLQWKGNSVWMRNLRLRALAMQTPAFRKRAARKASKAAARARKAGKASARKAKLTRKLNAAAIQARKDAS